MAELVEVKDLAEISQQSICCSYKPYCRGIIKRGQCRWQFFFQMCLAKHMKKTVSFHFNILVLRASICHVCTIYNGNWTEWGAIWAEIIRVISKSSEHTVWVQFEITSMISDQNCTVQGSITSLLHPFWNRPSTGLGQFNYFIDAVLS